MLAAAGPARRQVTLSRHPATDPFHPTVNPSTRQNHLSPPPSTASDFSAHRASNGGSIANHEFEKARFYSDEEREEHDNLKRLREKYKLDTDPALIVRRDEIEKAVSKMVGNDDDSDSAPS